MKHILILIITFSIILGCSVINDCSNQYDNDIPDKVPEELMQAYISIIQNFDSLKSANGIGWLMTGQKATPLAVDLMLWNLVDGAYLEGIRIESKDLILFKSYSNSCEWDNEYIIYNSNKESLDKTLDFQKVKVDIIEPKWSIVRTKNKTKPNNN